MKSNSPEEPQSFGDQSQAEEKSEESKKIDFQQTLAESDKSNSNWKHKSSHSKELIISNIKEGISTRSKVNEYSSALALISEI